jgi:hypothetical protein
MYSTDAKGSTQTNQKNKLGLKRMEQKGNWRLPWSGAPDSVRCTRVLQLKLLTFGFPRRSSAIIHRTVRCTSGATAICAQRSTLQSEQYCGRSQSSGQRGTGLSGATRGQSLQRLTSSKPQQQDDVAAHRTVRCVLRQHTSPTASFWLVAINTTPTGHFKVWEPKQHSKSSS